MINGDLVTGESENAPISPPQSVLNLVYRHVPRELDKAHRSNRRSLEQVQGPIFVYARCTLHPVLKPHPNIVANEDTDRITTTSRTSATLRRSDASSRSLVSATPALLPPGPMARGTVRGRTGCRYVWCSVSLGAMFDHPVLIRFTPNHGVGHRGGQSCLTTHLDCRLPTLLDSMVLRLPWRFHLGCELDPCTGSRPPVRCDLD